MPDIEKYSRSDFEKAKETCKNAKNGSVPYFMTYIFISWQGQTTWNTDCADDADAHGYEHPNPRISAQSAASAFPFRFDDYYFINPQQIKLIHRPRFSGHYPKNDIGEHFADVSKMVEIGSEAKRSIDDIMLSRYAYYLDKNQKILDHMGSTESAMNLRYVDEHEKSNELVRTKTNSGGVSSYQVRCVRCYFFSYQSAMNLLCVDEHEKSNELVRTKTNSGGVSSYQVRCVRCYFFSYQSAMNLRCVDEHEKSNELVRTKTNSGGVSSYQVRCVRCYFFSYQLAANLFRATQTDDKLRRENIRGRENANMTHFVVGKKVRQTIRELGGTMPEDLELPGKSIQEIEEKPKKKLLRGEFE